MLRVPIGSYDRIERTYLEHKLRTIESMLLDIDRICEEGNRDKAIREAYKLNRKVKEFELKILYAHCKGLIEDLRRKVDPIELIKFKGHTEAIRETIGYVRRESQKDKIIELAERVREIRPDGDCYGHAATLARQLRRAGIECEVVKRYFTIKIIKTMHYYVETDDYYVDCFPEGIYKPKEIVIEVKDKSEYEGGEIVPDEVWDRWVPEYEPRMDERFRRGI